MAFNPQDFLGNAAPVQNNYAAPTVPPPAPQQQRQWEETSSRQPYRSNRNSSYKQNAPQGGYQNQPQGQQNKEPAHGKLYSASSKKTRREYKVVTLTPEGVQYLLQNLNQVANTPGAKVKIKIFEYSEQMKQSIRQKNGFTEGNAYIKVDMGRDSQPNSGGNNGEWGDDWNNQ